MQNRSAGSKAGKPKNKIESNLHDGHRIRLMEKALKDGIESLEDHEVVEIMLFNTIPRGNTNDIAHRLLDYFGSVHNICAADISELVKIDGVGKKTADFLKMLPLFVKAYELSYFSKKMCLDSPETLGEYCKNLFIGASVEEAYLLCLNINKRVIKRLRLSNGGFTAVNLSLREIIRQAALTNATSVVLCHNHPNGVLFPSQTDITYTNNAAESLRRIDVAFEDHIIVAGDEYFSFRKEKIKIL